MKRPRYALPSNVTLAPHYARRPILRWPDPLPLDFDHIDETDLQDMLVRPAEGASGLRHPPAE